MRTVAGSIVRACKHRVVQSKDDPPLLTAALREKEERVRQVVGRHIQLQGTGEFVYAWVLVKE